MNVGTKSILFGVHQFLWHPWTVGRAWRLIHGRWPTFSQWLCIFVHDIGYWGCPEMDGIKGKEHPVRGAELAKKLCYYRWRLKYQVQSADRMSEAAYRWTLGHSTHYANKHLGGVVSDLYLADKASILFDPPWFYLLRGWLSGEVAEYVSREDPSLTPRQWLTNYRNRVKIKVEKA